MSAAAVVETTESYGRIETDFRAKRGAGRKLLVPFITGGVTGLLIPPSGPRVVGTSASASTTSMPLVTRPKIV